MQFTICTVCFNAEATISSCIDSVAALLQHEDETPDFEYLIIDGDSNDCTKQIIADKSSLFPEGTLRVISEPDEGIYDAMNKGINNARGRFIIFINADDTIAPRALEFAREVLSQVPNPETVDGIAGSVEVQAGEGIDPKLAGIKKVRPNMLKGPVPKDMVAGHQAMFFSVQKAKEIGGFNTRYKIAADYDFYIRSIQANSRWLLIDRRISTFLLGGTSFGIIPTAKEYRQVRIDNGMNRLDALGYYGINVLNSIITRGFKDLK